MKTIFSRRAGFAYRISAVMILIIAVVAVSCVSPGQTKSGASAVYSVGLRATLISWKDGGTAEYRGNAAEGRWLLAEVRVDYDGNAPFGEIPTSDLSVLWEAPDGSKGRTVPVWIHDPTPGAAGVDKRDTLRVRMTNLFTLAFDIPREAVPIAFAVGDTELSLSSEM